MSAHPTVVQVSLDLTDLDEALELASEAVIAGIDWLEAGTPLLLAHGLEAVRELRAAFPAHPLVADLKTMDGGFLEAEMMAKAGATHVVVMARAHAATIAEVVQAAREMNLSVMGDNLGCPDKVDASKMLEQLGVDYVIHHVGYDERRAAARDGYHVSPLDDLADVVGAVTVPVQAVGGLTVEQAVSLPTLGVPLVVFGAPLVISGDAFTPADDVGEVLTNAVARIRDPAA